MKKLIALAVAFIAVGAQTASADPLMKYTYFDAAYQWTKDVENGGDGANGLDTKISYTPIENFALEGGYNYSEIDLLDANQDLFNYGVAGWYSFCDGIDIVARVGGLHREVDTDVGGFSDDGVYAGGGLRTLLTDQIEGNFDVTYRYIDGENDWTYALTGLAALTDSLAFKAAVSMDDDSVLALTGGIRLAM